MCLSLPTTNPTCFLPNPLKWIQLARDLRGRIQLCLLDFFRRNICDSSTHKLYLLSFYILKQRFDNISTKNVQQFSLKGPIESYGQWFLSMYNLQPMVAIHCYGLGSRTRDWSGWRNYCTILKMVLSYIENIFQSPVPDSFYRKFCECARKTRRSFNSICVISFLPWMHPQFGRMEGINWEM